MIQKVLSGARASDALLHDARLADHTGTWKLLTSLLLCPLRSVESGTSASSKRAYSQLVYNSSAHRETACATTCRK